MKHLPFNGLPVPEKIQSAGGAVFGEREHILLPIAKPLQELPLLRRGRVVEPAPILLRRVVAFVHAQKVVRGGQRLHPFPHHDSPQSPLVLQSAQGKPPFSIRRAHRSPCLKPAGQHHPAGAEHIAPTERRSGQYIHFLHDHIGHDFRIIGTDFSRRGPLRTLEHMAANRTFHDAAGDFRTAFGTWFLLVLHAHFAFQIPMRR